jgi:hypothetical protein
MVKKKGAETHVSRSAKPKTAKTKTVAKPAKKVNVKARAALKKYKQPKPARVIPIPIN